MKKIDFLKILSLAEEVITHTRNTLIVHLRYMDSALGQLTRVPFPDSPLATDGENLYYSPLHVLNIYQRSQEQTARDYLHVILHCVFRHFFVSPLLRKDLWNLACDIAVEAAIDDMELPITEAPRCSKQHAVKTSLIHAVGTLTAEKLYHHYLVIDPSPEEVRALSALFHADDHEIWYKPKSPTAGGPDDHADEEDRSESEATLQENDPQSDEENSDNDNAEKQDVEGDRGDSSSQKNVPATQSDPSDEKDDDGKGDDADPASEPKSAASREALAEKWKEIASRIKEDLETFSRRHGDKAGNMMQSLREVTREKYDYTAFLKKFATLHEAMTINDEEFDYVYYTYGIRLYGNMPLVEPLEYKDVKRIRDFVIVIDTSGSVQGKLVQRFLQKTYNILKTEESFFVKFNLHIVQCDARVQTDDKITSQEEFDNYLKTMTLRGFGGTDFRPAFEYVNKLIDNHEFTNLKGLIYFTDGYGDYPQQKPPYETAFVFVDEDGRRVPEVPPWAIKLILKPEEV